MNYAIVEAGVVTDAPVTLRGSWRAYDGLDQMTPAELAAIGWYPALLVDEVPPEGAVPTGEKVMVFDAAAGHVTVQYLHRPLVPVPRQSKIRFLMSLHQVLGPERTLAILAPTSMFGLIYAAAAEISYDDVFIGLDGDPVAPSYAAQLLAAGLVTEAEIAALMALWPLQ